MQCFAVLLTTHVLIHMYVCVHACMSASIYVICMYVAHVHENFKLLQCVTIYRSVLQFSTVCHRLLQCAIVCCSVSVLQCAIVCCSVP